MRRHRTTFEDGPLHLTEDGLAKLREELGRLKRSLPRLIEETARTAAYGDRSENAEYKAAKGSLRRANFRILELEDQLKRAVVIPEDAGPAGAVRLGATVVLESGGKELVFRIVGPQEADPAAGRISHLSPLGAALLGRKKGEEAVLRTLGGERAYRIREIR